MPQLIIPIAFVALAATHVVYVLIAYTSTFTTVVDFTNYIVIASVFATIPIFVFTVKVVVAQIWPFGEEQLSTTSLLRREYS